MAHEGHDGLARVATAAQQHLQVFAALARPAASRPAQSWRWPRTCRRHSLRGTSRHRRATAQHAIAGRLRLIIGQVFALEHAADAHGRLRRDAQWARPYSACGGALTWLRGGRSRERVEAIHLIANPDKLGGVADPRL